MTIFVPTKMFNCIHNKYRFLTVLIKKGPQQWFWKRNTSAGGSATKDVILFEHENSKFFRNLNIFGASQFVFWTYLSSFALTLRDAPVDSSSSDLKWYERVNLGENKFRNGMTIIFFLIGSGMLAISWGFTRRSVRYLILRPDGKSVAFVTYNILGNNIVRNVPISHCSAKQSRLSLASYLPVKVKDSRFYYVLDKRGRFLNPVLFDNTVGLNRHL